MLVGPSKCLKQIIQIKLNRVKNLNWPGTNRLAIWLQAWPSIWTRDYREQIQLAVRAGLELGGLRIASPALQPLGHAASKAFFKQNFF